MTPKIHDWGLLLALLLGRLWGLLSALSVAAFATFLLIAGISTHSPWLLGLFAVVYVILLLGIAWARYSRRDSKLEIASGVVSPAVPLIIFLSFTFPQFWNQPRVSVLATSLMTTPLLNASALDRCAYSNGDAGLSDHYYVTRIKNSGPPLESLNLFIQLPGEASIGVLAVLNPETFPQHVQCAPMQTSPPVLLAPMIWKLAGLKPNEERLIAVQPGQRGTGGGSLRVTLAQTGNVVIDLRRARLGGFREPIAEAASAPAPPYRLCTTNSLEGIAYAFLGQLYAKDQKLALLFSVVPSAVKEEVLSAIDRGACQMYVLVYDDTLHKEHRGTVLTIAQMSYLYVMAASNVAAKDVVALYNTPYQVGWTGGLANDAVSALARALGRQRVCELWHCALNPSGPPGWLHYPALKYKWQVGDGVDVAILADAAHGDSSEEFVRLLPQFHFINIKSATVTKMVGAEIYFPAHLPMSCLGSASSRGPLDTAAVAVTAGRSNNVPEELKKRLGAAFVAIVPNDCTFPRQVWDQLRADDMIAQ